ncbi:MAG: hypothetical protein IPK60_07720 [Sandaracinaceae bacterium]|nr:hypothetical protein [Sandaracinaceae bacterium]
MHAAFEGLEAVENAVGDDGYAVTWGDDSSIVQWLDTDLTELGDREHLPCSGCDGFPGSAFVVFNDGNYFVLSRGAGDGEIAMYDAPGHRIAGHAGVALDATNYTIGSMHVTATCDGVAVVWRGQFAGLSAPDDNRFYTTFFARQREDSLVPIRQVDIFCNHSGVVYGGQGRGAQGDGTVAAVSQIGGVVRIGIVTDTCAAP